MSTEELVDTCKEEADVDKSMQHKGFLVGLLNWETFVHEVLQADYS